MPWGQMGALNARFGVYVPPQILFGWNLTQKMGTAGFVVRVIGEAEHGSLGDPKGQGQKTEDAPGGVRRAWWCFLAPSHPSSAPRFLNDANSSRENTAARS